MSKIIRLPGLIDPHVHLREPGAVQKEDFETGTKAAIAGGYTLVLDMPNNPIPTISPETLQEKIDLAKGHPVPRIKYGAGFDTGSINIDSRWSLPRAATRGGNDKGSRIYSDVGFHFGASAKSIKYFSQVSDKVFGLKVYMNPTTGDLLMEDEKVLEAVFSAWPKEKIIMVHAEEDTLQKAISLAKKFDKKLHVCHVSLAKEIELIKTARQEGLLVSCEVTCHHLFLTDKDVKRLGTYGMMRPPLPNKEDQKALWQAVADGTLDMIGSDHAPHTKQEKDSPDKVVNGVPGLETTLPLLLTAVSEGRLTIERLIELTYTNPEKIFNTPDQEETWVEVDLEESYTISNDDLQTKCGWTPFEGMEVTGRVKKVVLRGQPVFDQGKVSGPFGKILYPC